MSLEITRQKKFWDREAEDFDAIYTKKKGRLGVLLDRVFRWDMYARYEYAMEKSDPVAGRSFLDVGCGTGLYSLELAKRKARRVVGIDISDKMIKICRMLAEREGLDDICSFERTDALGFNPEMDFDICIGMGLFDYIEDPLPVLKKIRKLLCGRVIMSFPRLWTWRAPVRKARLALKGCNVYFYRKARVEAMLREAGLTNYEVQKIGQLYCVTAYR